jgi:hypothetical protein
VRLAPDPTKKALLNENKNACGAPSLGQQVELKIFMEKIF